MASTRELDVIIFGASGFTGKYTVLHAIELLSQLKWGVAGRSQKKLEAVLKEMGSKAGQPDLVKKIPIVVADVADESSLKAMAGKCRIVVNCCGPFRYFGEPVIKACVDQGTHHVDVSGEPFYMENMQLKYNQPAKDKGIYVVSACGFDSIPADMGVLHLESQFAGTVNSVESYIDLGSVDATQSGSSSPINYGTWASAIGGLSTVPELLRLRRELFKDRLPRLNPPLAARPLLHKSTVADNKWCLPFMGSDRSVVMRTQRYLYETEQKRPVHMRPYFTTGSFQAAMVIILVGIVFGTLARFKWGRTLLSNFPRLFSLGMVSKEGPAEADMNNTKFSMHFIGVGWAEKLADPCDEYTTPPTKKIITRVSAVNPGYGATCIALLLSAVTILKEEKALPNGFV